MPGLAPLLVVYDAENPHCRRRIDWIRRRDRLGLIVAFPWQNPELPRIAPELAGRPLHLLPHGLDTRTREVWAGQALMPHLWARVSGLRWVTFLVKIPVISRLFYGRCL